MQSSASRSLHLRFDRRHTARMVTQEEKKQTRIKENIIMFYTCWTVCPLRCFLIVQIKQFILNMMWLQNTVCQKISAVLPAHTYTVQLPSGSIFILQWVINELFFFYTQKFFRSVQLLFTTTDKEPLVSFQFCLGALKKTGLKVDLMKMMLRFD